MLTLSVQAAPSAGSWGVAGTVTQCYSTGALSGAGLVGGLVGENLGAVIRCHSGAVVSAQAQVGGLVGQNGGEQYRGGVAGGLVRDSYSTGVVSSGYGDAGGLVGINAGDLTCCYSTGEVSGQSAGGLVGCGFVDVYLDNGGWGVFGTATDCFWDTETSGQTTSEGGISKTTAQMQTAKTFLQAGWDFTGEMQNGTHQTWQIPREGGYPVLAILSGYVPPQLHGLGTPEDPYLIFDALELGAMVYHDHSASYRLAASIDLSGIRWRLAVISHFAGTFDGDGHTISHLTIQGDGLGLFGHLESGAKVKKLGVVDVNITGPNGAIGALVWSNNGYVDQCFSTGVVSGDSQVGGLVGDNSGIVTQCYSTCAVRGGYYSVGGLVGNNGYEGIVTQCYSAGGVIAKSYVGGLLCGSGKRVTACFWDYQTSGQVTSAGGMGRNTADMKTAKTFLDAGWDFVGETKNGTADIWWVLEGKDYPHLWWEAAKK